MKLLAVLVLILWFLLPAPESRAQAPAPPMALADTLVTTGRRVRTQEVIEAIGRRLQEESIWMQDLEFTNVVTGVGRDHPGLHSGDYLLEESATRVHERRGKPAQSLLLGFRSRRYKNNRLVEERRKPLGPVVWHEPPPALLEAMPFRPAGRDRYHYEIVDRRLVGNSLIYKIRFRPKSSFAALPSGVAWVDYSHWVIRKLEAHLTEVVPNEIFLKSVPVYRFTQERFGAHWFETEVYWRLNLRRVPLGHQPASVEYRLRRQDVVVNGTPCSAQDTIPADQRYGNLKPDEFWLSETAAADSLAAYWAEVDQQWTNQQSDLVADSGDMAVVADSLRVKAARLLAAARTQGPGWAMEWQPISVPSFNRVQGLVWRAGLDLGRRFQPEAAHLSLTAGYGWSNRRPVGTVAATLPLTGTWSVTARANQEAVLFAGDGRRRTRSLTALLYGSDPNHYLEQRRWGMTWQWRPTQGWTLTLAGDRRRERPLTVHTTWNAWGRNLHPESNRQAENLRATVVALSLEWLSGSWRWKAGGRWAGVEQGIAGDQDLFRWSLAGRREVLDGAGNQWILMFKHTAWDRTAPRQWKSWLGDRAGLRGYPAGSLSGDRATNISLDLGLGHDLLGESNIPLLKDGHLQPLLFADWGRTPNQGSRWDVGLGLSHRLDLPLVKKDNKLKLMWARPVGNGAAGRGWRVLVGLQQ